MSRNDQNKKKTQGNVKSRGVKNASKKAAEASALKRRQQKEEEERQV
jgi:hypothetical protein